MPSRPDPPPPRVPDRCYTLGICGGVAERTNATVLKTVVRASVPGVRIPPPPPPAHLMVSLRNLRFRGPAWLRIASLQDYLVAGFRVPPSYRPDSKERGAVG